MSEEKQQSHGDEQVLNLNFTQRDKERGDSRVSIRLHVNNGRIVSAEAHGERGEIYECNVNISLKRTMEDGSQFCWCCPSPDVECYQIPCGESCP